MKTTVMRCLFIPQLWQATHILHPLVGILQQQTTELIQEALIRVNAEGERVPSAVMQLFVQNQISISDALGAINPSTPASFTASKGMHTHGATPTTLATPYNCFDHRGRV